LLGVAVGLVVLALPASAQQPAAEPVLRKAADYVRGFVLRFANVVAEENYRRESQRIAARPRYRSDFLLVRYPGAAATWLTFRDVIEIDGRAVRDQQERLSKLFLEPWSDAAARADEIGRESARYFGPWSNPLLALSFMQEFYQPRFRFSTGGLDRRLGAGIREVRFKEAQSPTVLQSPGQHGMVNVWSSGSVWVDEDTGRIAKTRLILGVAPSNVIVETLFRFDVELQTDVPSEMREWYVTAFAGENKGVATYGRFRRFQVRTEEVVDAPPSR
jgi:hypothetical protein